ncbi:MAG: Gmad2 immunoglobulin-like domain-containing protein [Candidatus Paceibacterota bacterium]
MKKILYIVVVLVITFALFKFAQPAQTPTTNVANKPRVSAPLAGATVSSPLSVTGEAPGTWYFEASFHVVLVDWDGKIIAQGSAQAKGEWMTTAYVPFEAKLTFTADPKAYSNKATLILKKDNPSGLPANDDAIEVPIFLAAASTTVPPGPVACTMEAKLCPDGSYVARTGPNCEFTKCPPAPAPITSGIQGTVTLGPTCPVMRDPPDPQCADKPYQTTVQIFKKGSATATVSAPTDALGHYTATLAPGTYTVQAAGGQMLPRCAPQDVIVMSKVMSELNLSCDTGIR